MGRVHVAALTISAATLIGIAVHEGYRDTAYIPVPGDVPTIGFGSTTNNDGTRVQMGQRTDPVRALIRLGQHVSDKERAIRACIGDVPLFQHEWDAYVSLTYNIGTGAFCNSTLVRRLKQKPPDYAGACAQILRWDRFQGRQLAGLTKRRAEEHAKCRGQ